MPMPASAPRSSAAPPSRSTGSSQTLLRTRASHDGRAATGCSASLARDGCVSSPSHSKSSIDIFPPKTRARPRARARERERERGGAASKGRSAPLFRQCVTSARLCREDLVIGVAILAAQRGACALITRHVIANLKIACHRQRLELHVDRTVVVEKRDADAVPEFALAALSDDVT